MKCGSIVEIKLISQSINQSSINSVDKNTSSAPKTTRYFVFKIMKLYNVFPSLLLYLLRSVSSKICEAKNC